ncbi:hypothetical protein BJY01DRAFT_251110 [Aspergillus pseudoustus]|uniref:Uncharacterized protein n=1 Tax=Aspergillus pseudoustus TaxID=1810923 RepID=A0ABR4JDI3_9EURO
MSSATQTSAHTTTYSTPSRNPSNIPRRRLLTKRTVPLSADDCRAPASLCAVCKPLYQELLMAYGVDQLLCSSGFYPVVFMNTFPAKTKTKFLGTARKSLERTLSLSYGMADAKVWKVAFKNESNNSSQDEDGDEDTNNGKGKAKDKSKDPAITLKVLFDFPHKIQVFDDTLRGLFLQFPVSFLADEETGATEWMMQLPENCTLDEDGNYVPGQEEESLAKLRYWKQVDKLLVAKRVINKDVRK